MNYLYYKELYHHGIKGQKWGVRRAKWYPIAAFKKAKPQSKDSLFVSGSSKTQDSESEYYRKKLPGTVRKELKRSMRKGEKIIVGDAPGIDRQVQDYLNKKKYSNVEVYGPGEKVRYAANSKWKTKPIPAPEFEEYSKEWLAKKDVAMTNASTKGMAIILDEGAKATRKNVQRLLDQNKQVKVYELNKYSKLFDKWVDPKRVNQEKTSTGKLVKEQAIKTATDVAVKSAIGFASTYFHAPIGAIIRR